MSGDGDTQMRWALALVDALVDGGVGRFVVSPGSRSTPIVLALLARALPLHVVIDERAAAFFALGMARRQHAPVALVCTSGSAGAHYLPAIIEAYEAGGVLVAVTADRPPEAQRVGASQTTTQTSLFGAHVACAEDLGPPDDTIASLRGVAGRVARAMALARRANAPAHINVPLRKPLEPAQWPTIANGPTAVPWAPEPLVCAADDVIRRLAEQLAGASAGVVVAGPAWGGVDVEPDAIRAFCERTGFVLYAECTSQLRDGVRTTRRGRAFARCDALAAVARAGAAPGPDIVVQIGASPVDPSVLAWASRSGAQHIVLTPSRWPDGQLTAAAIVCGDVGDTLRRLTVAIDDRNEPVDRGYGLSLSALDDRVWEAVRAGLTPDANTPRPLDEATALREVVASLPDEGFLFVGNSRAVRDLDAFCDALPPHVAVAHQRGVAGIDGNLAHVAGLAALGGPVTAVLGDVAAAHDVGGLAAARHARGSLVIVVIDNGGGRIFEQLPVAALPLGDAFERLWLTPPGVDMCAAAAAYGIATVQISDGTALREAVREAHERGGATLLRVQVAPEAVGAGHRAVAAALSRAFDAGTQ